MLTAIDNTVTVQPLPRALYIDTCVVEDNPWRKLFYTGTAGSTTEDFCATRLSQGAPYQFMRIAPKTNSLAEGSKNDIDAFIALMEPSMSQLAAAFGVSRQRIYDWRKGAGMSSENADRMNALLGVARMLNERASTSLPQVVTRKLKGGKSFWESIASGTDPVEAAEFALSIFEREDREREAIKGSLASRKISHNRERPVFSAHLTE